MQNYMSVGIRGVQFKFADFIGLGYGNFQWHCNAKELLRVGLHWRAPFIEDL